MIKYQSLKILLNLNSPFDVTSEQLLAETHHVISEAFGLFHFPGLHVALNVGLVDLVNGEFA